MFLFWTSRLLCYIFAAHKKIVTMVIFLQTSVSQHEVGWGGCRDITCMMGQLTWNVPPPVPWTSNLGTTPGQQTYEPTPCYWYLVDNTGDLFKLVHLRTLPVLTHTVGNQQASCYLNGPKIGPVQAIGCIEVRSPTDRRPIRPPESPANDTCCRCIFKVLYSTVQYSQSVSDSSQLVSRLRLIVVKQT